MKRRIVAVLLAGCMLAGSLQPVFAQEQGDVEEAEDLGFQETLLLETADEQEDFETDSFDAETADSEWSVDPESDGWVISADAPGMDVTFEDFEEEPEMDLIFEEDLEEEETGEDGEESADSGEVPFVVNGQEYGGTVSEETPQQKYMFAVGQEEEVRLIARAGVQRIQYSIENQDGETVWTSAPECDPETGLSEIDETIALPGGTYCLVIVLCDSFAGSYSFHIDTTEEITESGSADAEEAAEGSENEAVEEKEVDEAEAQEAVEDDSDLLEAASVRVTGVKLNKTKQTIARGKTATLTATVSPSKATNKKVTWKSSNTAVATVNSKGVVTAKKAGTATITVTTKDGAKKASCKVTVRVPVKSVKLNKTKQTIGNGRSFTLKATVSPSDATNKKVIWKSSNTKVAKVSSSGKVTAGASANGTAKITATTEDGKKVATCTVTVKQPNVTYRTHVQTYGWQGWKKNGQMSGTQGQSRRLEGINIKLTNAPYSGGIQYRTHIQTYGWESGWKSNGAMSGTQGQAKRLEAIQIKLTGEMAKHYDVYYRVHAQRFGWMGWAKNGASAGTSGYSLRLEGIQIQLVRKGGSAPGSTLRQYKKLDYKDVYRSTLRSVASKYDKYCLYDITGDGILDLIVHLGLGEPMWEHRIRVYSHNGPTTRKYGDFYCASGGIDGTYDGNILYYWGRQGVYYSGMLKWNGSAVVNQNITETTMPFFNYNGTLNAFNAERKQRLYAPICSVGNIQSLKMYSISSGPLA